MEPKEKAWELYHKYRALEGKFGDKVLYNYDAKQCALIAVDEILENVDYFFTELEKDGLPNKFDDEIEYWQEVKQEINKL
jgi:hypothetical protein